MRVKHLIAVSAMALAAACAAMDNSTKVPVATFDEATTAELASNALLAEWTGPHGGQPAFDRMDLALIKPALEAGMAASLAEIDAIANNPAKPTFENTLVAMERTGEPLDRAMTYYGIWSSNVSSAEFRKIQAE
ncbi:MAG: M3 family peptidase, partial [Burkholderiales bacterium]